jgi:Flp pilus assembly protein TadG
MKIMRPLPFLRRLGRDRSGAAAVEFGLIATMLTGLLIPMYDLGTGAYTKMRVQDAAEAGAQYALTHGFSASAITTAAQGATSLATNVATSPSPSQACGCIESNAVTTGGSITCGGSCPDGSKAGTYVTVATSATYTMLLSYPGLTNPMTITGLAVVRAH